MKKSFCLAFVLTSLVVLCLTGGCKVDVETPDYNLHTVTFECNGGSRISPQILVNGTTATEPRKDPTKDGLEFLGWYADPQFNTPFDFGTPITQDMTVYAKWVYKVYFYDYYGNIWKMVDVAHGYKVERPNENPIPNEWYRDFDNWYVDYELVDYDRSAVSKVSTVFDFETPITDSTKIYAGYRPNKWYTVKFETNGDIDIPSQQVGHGECVIPPSKDGYRFCCYEDIGFRTKFDFRTKITGAKTLYVRCLTVTEYKELPAGTDGTAGPSWTYVEFGDWPQTIKAGNVTVDENESVEVGKFTYYKGSDGFWYVKEMERASDTGLIPLYSDGTEVAQSSANSYRYFKVEPIKWRVLTTDYNGKKLKLLLAEDILLCRPLSYSPRDRDLYSFSPVRSYLNEDFFKIAFTDTSKNRIVASMVDLSSRSMNPDLYSNYWSNEGKIEVEEAPDCLVNDLIFILSVQEVTKESFGFGDDGSRRKFGSDYAKACGVKDHCWWLRSGISGCGGCCVYSWMWSTTADPSEKLGVVPALCVEN